MVYIWYSRWITIKPPHLTIKVKWNLNDKICNQRLMQWRPEYKAYQCVCHALVSGFPKLWSAELLAIGVKDDYCIHMCIIFKFNILLFNWASNCALLRIFVYNVIVVVMCLLHLCCTRACTLLYCTVAHVCKIWFRLMYNLPMGLLFCHCSYEVFF